MKHSDFDLIEYSYGPSRLLPQLPLRTFRLATLALFNDQPITALCTVVRPDPPEEEAEPQAALSQKLGTLRFGCKASYRLVGHSHDKRSCTYEASQSRPHPWGSFRNRVNL